MFSSRQALKTGSVKVPESIKFDSNNYRKHSDKNSEIIAGNGVYEQAKALNIPLKIIETDGKELVVVKRTDLNTTDAKRKKLALLDNSTADKVEWDLDNLSADFDLKDLAEFGLEDLPQIETEQGEIVEDEVPNAEEVETKVKKGDIWQLGEHRLMCGDSTVINDVIKLMDGNDVDLLFTDPPYNVAFNGRSGKFDVIKNDNLTETQFKDFIQAFLSVLKKISPTTYYICCNWAFYGILQLELKPKACIVWAKNVFWLGKGYRHQHEFILFDGFIDGSIIDESNLWQIKKDIKYKHPTQKPVALPARAIKNSSKSGQIVLDLFGGSGSTLIACEQLKRKCFMMELDPHYCDVIITRWENLTGKKAVLCK